MATPGNSGSGRMLPPGPIVISCPKCGGSVQPVTGQQYTQCSWCQSVVLNNSLTVSLDRILPTEMTIDVECPTCQGTLRTGELDSHRALYCTGCYGILLKQADFSAVVRERAARRTVSEPAEPRAIRMESYQRQLPCPSCTRTMEVHPYYGPGNVVIDSCAECGIVWLDQGELTRIEQSTGGDGGHRSQSSLEAPYIATAADAEVQEPPSALQILADLLF